MQIPRGRLFRLCVWLFWAMLHVQVCAAGDAAPDRAALVNGAVVTREDFKRELQRVVRLRAGRKALGRDELAALKKQALENLIVRELLCREAGKRGITVPATTVQEQIAELRGKYRTEADFAGALQQRGLSAAALTAQLEQGMVIRKFIDAEFTAKVTVTGDEVKFYYEDHPDDFKESARFRISQILVKTDPSWDEEKKTAARVRIGQLRRRLLAGEDFALVAKEASECAKCKEGGDLGYFTRGQLAKQVEEAVLALKPGEVSGIMQDKEGFHILKLTELQPATTTPLASVQEKIRGDLVREREQKALAIFLKRVRGEAKVEILLEEESD